MVTVKGSLKGDLQSWSAYLSYYTLFAIVPIIAIALGVAHHLHWENTLRTMLQKYMPEKAVVDYILLFANRMLEKAKESSVQVVGIVLLIWAAIKILMRVDDVFLKIWEVYTKPKFWRRIANYLIIAVVYPLIFIAVIVLGIYLRVFLNFIDIQALFWILTILPTIIIFLLFSFLYFTLPYQKVHYSSAFIAGLLTTIAYQIIQWIFFAIIVKMSSNSAIYGAFAALPLFLVWINLSWTIFLFGAKLSYGLEKSHP